MDRNFFGVELTQIKMNINTCNWYVQLFLNEKMINIAVSNQDAIALLSSISINGEVNGANIKKDMDKNYLYYIPDANN